MKRYLPTYHTELNFTASISVWLRPREQCWHGNCRLHGLLFSPISRHTSFLLASGSSKFRLIALFIWGKTEKRKFVRKHNQSGRRKKQEHSLDKDQKNPANQPTNTTPNHKQTKAQLNKNTQKNPQHKKRSYTWLYSPNSVKKEYVLKTSSIWPESY